MSSNTLLYSPATHRGDVCGSIYAHVRLHRHDGDRGSICAHVHLHHHDGDRDSTCAHVRLRRHDGDRGSSRVHAHHDRGDSSDRADGHVCAHALHRSAL